MKFIPLTLLLLWPLLSSGAGLTISSTNGIAYPSVGGKKTLITTNEGGLGTEADLVSLMFVGGHKQGLAWGTDGYHRIYGDTNHSGSTGGKELHFDSVGTMSFNVGQGGQGGSAHFGSTGSPGMEARLQRQDPKTAGPWGMSCILTFNMLDYTNSVTPTDPAMLGWTSNNVVHLSIFNPGPTRTGVGTPGDTFSFTNAQLIVEFRTNDFFVYKNQTNTGYISAASYIRALDYLQAGSFVQSTSGFLTSGGEIRANLTGFHMNSGEQVSWSSDSSDANTGIDTALSRYGAGSLNVTNSATGGFGTFKANALVLAGTTNQVVFGATNTAPVSTTIVKWISVQVAGETAVYRLGLAQ